MRDIPIRWEVEVSQGQRAYFTGLLRGIASDIDPGDSLKEVRIVADDEYVSKIQALVDKMGKQKVRGPGTSLYTALSIEKEGTLSNVIFIRREFFIPDEYGTLHQTANLVAALYYCQLYHLSWQRRGYLYRPTADLYTHDLFAMSESMHDEYAIARLQNIFISQRLNLYVEAMEQTAPFFVQYDKPLSPLFDQVPGWMYTRGIAQLTPSARKFALLPIAYRFIFKPLALHFGSRAPIPLDYPFRAPNNSPEESALYRDVIAPYWIPIQGALEASFDSQFSKTEEALQDMTKTMDACLDRLLTVSTNL